MSGWVSPHPPSPIPLGAAGGGDGGGEVGGENGHPHLRRVDGALSRCRSQGRGVCAAGTLFRTSVLKWVALVLRSRVPLSLPVVELVPIHSAVRPRWTGAAFLHRRLALDWIRSPGKYRRRVRAVERISFFFVCTLLLV